MIEIRKANVPKEIPLLNRLERATFSSDFVSSSSWKKYKPYVVFWKSKLIGYVAVQPHVGLYSYKTKTHKKKRGVLHLTSMGITPPFRGKGIGALLMAWVMVYAKLGRFRSINATTRASNRPIISLLRTYRFKNVKKINKFYPDGETALVWEYSLK